MSSRGAGRPFPPAHATPVVIYFALGDRSAELLDRLKTWMAQNNAVIMAVLLLIRFA